MGSNKTSRRSSTRKHTHRTRPASLLIFALLVLLTVWLALPPRTDAGTSLQQESIAGLEIPLLQPGETLVIHTGYSLVYNEEHEQAAWVAYELTRDEVYGTYQRGDDFRTDPSIATGSATLDDYRGSGYDRGHLAPAADLVWSEQAMSDSFYLSNMSPQDPQFNRGIWSRLEAVVRTFAVDAGMVHVATGPVLTDGPFNSIGPNKVSVPNQFYKVVLDYQEPQVKAIGFLLPNAGSSRDLKEFAVPVDTIEALTGIDFFPQLPDVDEAALEATIAVSDWNFAEFRASSEEREAYVAPLQGKSDGMGGPPTTQSSSESDHLEQIRMMLRGIIIRIVDEIVSSLQ